MIASYTDPIIGGITFGLLLAIMLGPVFFTLLQTSLHEGFKAGVYLAFGVLMSDATLITICYTFASLLSYVDNHHRIMSWVGGCLLIGFGIFNMFHKVRLKEIDDSKKTIHAHFIVKGFLMNMVNPAVLFFWLGVVGLVTVKENYSKAHEVVFFGCTLLTVFSTDLIKAFIAHRIKSILNLSVLVWINRIIGLILIVFGIKMILGG